MDTDGTLLKATKPSPRESEASLPAATTPTSSTLPGTGNEDDHDDDNDNDDDNDECVLLSIAIGDKRDLLLGPLLGQHARTYRALERSTTGPPQPKSTPPHSPGNVLPHCMPSGIEILASAWVILEE